VFFNKEVVLSTEEFAKTLLSNNRFKKVNKPVYSWLRKFPFLFRTVELVYVFAGGVISLANTRSITVTISLDHWDIIYYKQLTQLSDDSNDFVL
jgi:hypothetical protein